MAFVIVLVVFQSLAILSLTQRVERLEEGWRQHEHDLWSAGR